MRVNARLNEDVNEEWTCDRGKFGMDYISSPDRLRRPLIRHGDQFHETSWDEALSLVADKLKAAGPSAAFLGGCRSSNEDFYAIQRLFREVLRSSNLDHRLGPVFPRPSDLSPLVGHDGSLASIAGLERMRTIVLFGCDLAVEQPIVFLRVRKAALRCGARVVEVQPSDGASGSHPNRVRDFAVASASYGPADAVPAAWGLLHAFVAAEPSLRSKLEPTIRDRMQTVRATDVGIELSNGAQGPITVLVGREVVGSTDVLPVLEPLRALVTAMGPESTLAIPATEVNEQGARDLGILPDTLPGCLPAPNPGLDTAGILEAAARGEAGVVWVSDLDIASRYYAPDKARRCLESAPFVVVTGMWLDATTSMADVVLPVCSVAEREGTFTNVERRVQRVWQAYGPALDVREEWRIAAALAARLGTPFAYASWRDVLRDIAANVPMFSECAPDVIGESGLPLDWTAVEEGPRP
jgi:NADH-quinone oxidoreductase subunit G